ncbi:MAG: heme ABC transporter ATP-binding protein CcmA [Chloroflexi bacterium HGW-Chloroflexi-6]|nr:MAG: heme ABC transporter ATP-binding protein CcmA [Chloroflexi bacterium HGW-Chloroflexi-6]
MPHLQTITLREIPENNRAHHPFNLRLLRGFEQMRFSAPVTFFVGENGTGKSTLLEAIACAAEMVTVGSESVKTDKSLSHARELAKYLRLAWTKRSHKGFFLRAEDFFGYAKRQNELRAEMETDLQEIEQEYKDRSEYAKSLARMSTAGQLGDMRRRYGEGLDARSHGESFLALFQSRFVPDGLYLLDEPEAPLSPLRQLGLIAAIHEMVAQNGQFIIASHSPILMAYPGAEIFHFEDGKIKKVGFNDLEHVRLMRDFLNNPEAFLTHIIKG